MQTSDKTIVPLGGTNDKGLEDKGDGEGQLCAIDALLEGTGGVVQHVIGSHGRRPERVAGVEHGVGD